MIVGIMQPYFFPYIGYFQLINAVDAYVNLDHVSFMKRSYMTRNVLKNNIGINIPCLGASQNKSCRDTLVDLSGDWFKKFHKTLEMNYKKDKNYISVISEIINPWYDDVVTNHSPKYQPTISEFNFCSIYRISEYLGINVGFYGSYGITDQKREKGLQDIVKHFKGDTYINAIGGQTLYSKENFASQNIDLKFIKNKSNLPNTSILDILFRYDKELITQELNNYELI